MSKSPAEMAKAMEDDFESLLHLDYTLKALHRRSQSHPDDIDNLHRWALLLLRMSRITQLESPNGALELVQTAMGILQIVMLRDETNSYTKWVFGQAMTRMAFLTIDLDKAKQFFDAATYCFQQAVDDDPACELFNYSLELSVKAPEQVFSPMVKKDRLSEDSGLGSSNAEGMSSVDVESKLACEYLRKAAEEKLKSDPDDVQTLTRLAVHLLVLSQYQSPSDSTHMIDAAIWHLAHASGCDPTNPYTYWLLGRTFTARAFLTHNPRSVMDYFELAATFFKQADYRDPDKNELFAYSFKQSEKYLEPGKEVPLELLTYIGPSSSSKAEYKEEEYDKVGYFFSVYKEEESHDKVYMEEKKEKVTRPVSKKEKVTRPKGYGSKKAQEVHEEGVCNIPEVHEGGENGL